MFNSTGNNFGAGTISFKDYQCDDYIVLNSKFTIDTTSAAYKAASVLEINVPDLSINKSAVTGIVIRFLDHREMSGKTYIYDGGTAVKSWVKDKNTLCIEKFDKFDEMGSLIVYIYALYAKKHMASVAQKLTKTYTTLQQETKYLSTTDAIMVLTDNWVFYHIEFTYYTWSYRDKAWEGTLLNFPTDVTIDVPFPGDSNQYHDRWTA